MAKSKWRRHAFIPDPQNKEGSPTNHLRAAGNYLAEKQPEVIVIAGDWWDLPAFGSYKSDAVKVAEGLSYAKDLAAGRAALDVFLKPIRAVKRYRPQIHFCMGNHEHRSARVVEENPMLKGLIGEEGFGLKGRGIKVHPFLQPVVIDQIAYAHYFCMDSNGRVMNSKRGQSSARAQVNNVGMSATAGHKQGLDVYVKESSVTGRRRGVIAGSFYQYAEDYLGPQGNDHWHGILLKHEVHDGDYNLMEVSLDYLLRKYS